MPYLRVRHFCWGKSCLAKIVELAWQWLFGLTVLRVKTSGQELPANTKGQLRNADISVIPKTTGVRINIFSGIEASWRNLFTPFSLAVSPH